LDNILVANETVDYLKKEKKVEYLWKLTLKKHTIRWIGSSYTICWGD